MAGPTPDLLGWVACFALVASVPETDALPYPARNLVPPYPSSAYAITNRG